jgi:putative SOS response-associated peptidase YedK
MYTPIKNFAKFGGAKINKKSRKNNQGNLLFILIACFSEFNYDFMCGRYSFAPDLKIVNEHYSITVNDGKLLLNFNCAPTQLLPVITNEIPLRFSLFRWGLIPFWAKGVSIGNKLINTRAETILEKPSFRQSFKHRRCIVPADAFYEWKAMGLKGRKKPYRIFLKNQPVFSMAGLWDLWKSPVGESIFSFSIITTSPNEIMADIHNRMPVILPKEAEKFWIESYDEKELLGLLKPFPADQMEAYRISELVNSPANNTAEVAKPV